MPDFDAGRQAHAALRRLLLSHEDTHQRGLPRPVGADEADFLSRVDFEGDPGEHVLRAVVPADLVERNHESSRWFTHRRAHFPVSRRLLPQKKKPQVTFSTGYHGGEAACGFMPDSSGISPAAWTDLSRPRTRRT